MSEKEAIEKFVADGDYLVYECNYLQRGPSALIREVIRQQKKDLWLGAKFTWVAAALLVGAGCVSKLDVGFFLFGPVVEKAIREGQGAGVRVLERGDDEPDHGGSDGPAVHPRQVVRWH